MQLEFQVPRGKRTPARTSSWARSSATALAITVRFAAAHQSGAQSTQKTYASSTQRLCANGFLNLLEESQAGDHKTTPYHHRLKELAKALAALDPKGSADLILDIAELPARSDGWVRLALLEALVFAGVSIPESRMTAMLEPVLAENAKGTYKDMYTMILVWVVCGVAAAFGGELRGGNDRAPPPFTCAITAARPSHARVSRVPGLAET